ncbi:receptor-type tyrosine-protein phosphatase alpha-like isoform X1 [Apostichopus japonicus]|uniref:receptor-type tyrosine-protein phosphatase alpha-like isoform X1 n=1 Tax=Stichopus japonicus TaxID=307972 RepID=UPI003AB7FCAE
MASFGTPPVVEYRLFTEESEGEDWPSTFIRVNASNDQDKYDVIIEPLEPDTEYDFRVTAVREGPNGDGPPGPILKRAKTNTLGSVGLIVGATIGTVSFAIITLLAVYGIWKYQRSTAKPKNVKRQTDESKEVTSEAPFDYENVIKDSGHTNVVRYVPSKVREECTPSATGNDNTIDGYEIPSIHISEGAQAKQQINKDVQKSKEKPTTYLNNSDDEFSPRRPMAISRFPLFMKSSTAKEMISATFKRLEEVSPSTNDSSFSGASPGNLHKNRFGDIVPLDNHRPMLKSMCLTQGGNDYINASIVNISGLNQTLIMTQAPLSTTVEDFWRLVFDYHCQTIIMLNESDSENHDAIKYWPEVNDIKIGTMTISTCLIEKKQLYTVHECTVAHLSYRESIKVKRFILNNWPKSGDSLIPLIHFITATGFGDRGATLVHCIDGASRSGVYATVCSEINRIKKRQTIHVFDTVKNIKVSNPNAIITKEDYMMCHQLLNCYLTEMQDYEVIV